jgi:hypothetical protein
MNGFPAKGGGSSYRGGFTLTPRIVALKDFRVSERVRECVCA